MNTSSLLSLLPAGAGGCSCGWQRWVEVVLARSCRETQTALCRRWCRAGEPSSLIVLPISHCSPPVRLKVMNNLLLPCHLLAPPFPSYMCICLTSTSVCAKANYVFVFFCCHLLLCCHQCRLYILLLLCLMHHNTVFLLCICISWYRSCVDPTQQIKRRYKYCKNI